MTRVDAVKFNRRRQETIDEGQREDERNFRERKCCSIFSEQRFTEKESVLQTQRVHLFPFRTQKLSSAVVKILYGRLYGKIAQC